MDMQEIEVLLYLPRGLVYAVQDRAIRQGRRLTDLVHDILEAWVSDPANALENFPLPREADAETLALIESVKALPLNPNAIIPPTGSLKEALAEAIRRHPTDYNYDWAAWQREWEEIEAHMDQMNRDDDIAEGRG